ncbi:hypothetical protein EV126DRAFT_76053 [Verticillium dahliae]|nr:hypothetical protein EV126DRAFT_76053 [Verticillium dahliae]
MVPSTPSPSLAGQPRYAPFSTPKQHLTRRVGAQREVRRWRRAAERSMVLWRSGSLLSDQQRCQAVGVPFYAVLHKSLLLLVEDQTRRWRIAVHETKPPPSPPYRRLSEPADWVLRGSLTQNARFPHRPRRAERKFTNKKKRLHDHGSPLIGQVYQRASLPSRSSPAEEGSCWSTSVPDPVRPQGWQLRWTAGGGTARKFVGLSRQRRPCVKTRPRRCY